jgi:hypothetical protein
LALHRNPQGDPGGPVFIANPAQTLLCFTAIRDRNVQPDTAVGELNEQQGRRQVAAPNHALQSFQQLSHQGLIPLFGPLGKHWPQKVHAEHIGRSTGVRSRIVRGVAC